MYHLGTGSLDLSFQRQRHSSSLTSYSVALCWNAITLRQFHTDQDRGGAPSLTRSAGPLERRPSSRRSSRSTALLAAAASPTARTACSLARIGARLSAHHRLRSARLRQRAGK